MAAIYKVLGTQVAPGQTVTDLYTTTAGYAGIVSTLAITNTTGTSGTYRIAVVPSGQTLGTQHYIAYEQIINGYESVYLTLGISMAAGDKIKVFAQPGIAFTAFGTEVN